MKYHSKDYEKLLKKLKKKARKKRNFNGDELEPEVFRRRNAEGKLERSHKKRTGQKENIYDKLEKKRELPKT